jgi:hypothetical protein
MTLKGNDNLFARMNSKWNPVFTSPWHEQGDSLKKISRSLQSSCVATACVRVLVGNSLSRNFLYIRILTMKSIVATLATTTLLAATAVSAFAPRQSTTVARAEISRPATAELEGLVGVDLESGKKIVSAYNPEV